uniref:EF-hand domain-containing protein n=1 Tax=Lotharella globosa TaxID=91324 RepID=A0A7S4DQK3_9EUKA|mmetsp:Transcript_11403/g.21914  ORF Transcript_11403/g.21914 Transcript_11403/m.21914 type:complete len:114 (+) Transcript_11403:32-373(+)
MSQYSGAEGVSPESLSVSEERFDAAEKIFRRFDENDSGTLYAGELRELARAYDLLLPGDGELTYFVEALGGTSEGSPKVTKDAFLTFWAAAEKGEAVSAEKKQKSESEALVKD